MQFDGAFVRKFYSPFFLLLLFYCPPLGPNQGPSVVDLASELLASWPESKSAQKSILCPLLYTFGWPSIGCSGAQARQRQGTLRGSLRESETRVGPEKVPLAQSVGASETEAAAHTWAHPNDRQWRPEAVFAGFKMTKQEPSEARICIGRVRCLHILRSILRPTHTHRVSPRPQLGAQCSSCVCGPARYCCHHLLSFLGHSCD